MLASLSQFDSSFGPPKPALESVIPNGLFTIVFPDGSHRTLKIHTKRQTAKFAPGRRLLSILVGPDNTSDFEAVAWVGEDGIRPFSGRGGKIAEYGNILWNWLVNGDKPDGYEILESRRCLVCGRTLSTPLSLERGVGDECWERYSEGEY